MSFESSGGAVQGEESSTPQRPIRQGRGETPLDNLSDLGAALPPPAASDVPVITGDTTDASATSRKKRGPVAAPYAPPRNAALQLIDWGDEYGSIRKVFPKKPDDPKKRRKYGNLPVPPDILDIPNIVERARATHKWRTKTPTEQAAHMERIKATHKEDKQKASSASSRGSRTSSRNKRVATNQAKADAERQKMKEAAKKAAEKAAKAAQKQARDEERERAAEERRVRLAEEKVVENVASNKRRLEQQRKLSSKAKRMSIASTASSRSRSRSRSPVPTPTGRNSAAPAVSGNATDAVSSDDGIDTVFPGDSEEIREARASELVSTKLINNSLSNRRVKGDPVRTVLDLTDREAKRSLQLVVQHYFQMLQLEEKMREELLESVKVYSEEIDVDLVSNLELPASIADNSFLALVDQVAPAPIVSQHKEGNEFRDVTKLFLIAGSEGGCRSGLDGIDNFERRLSYDEAEADIAVDEDDDDDDESVPLSVGDVLLCYGVEFDCSTKLAPKRVEDRVVQAHIWLEDGVKSLVREYLWIYYEYATCIARPQVDTDGKSTSSWPIKAPVMVQGGLGDGKVRLYALGQSDHDASIDHLRRGLGMRGAAHSNALAGGRVVRYEVKFIYDEMSAIDLMVNEGVEYRARPSTEVRDPYTIAKSMPGMKRAKLFKPKSR